MIIKILGSGCTRCKMLEELARQAVDELGIEAEVVKVTDMAQIMSYGVMSTPGLVIDEMLRLSGRLPSLVELTGLIERSRVGNE